MGQQERGSAVSNEFILIDTKMASRRTTGRHPGSCDGRSRAAR